MLSIKCVNCKCRNNHIQFFLYLFLFHFIRGHIKVTSEEVVRAYIERIKEVNPLLNAVVEDRFEAAIEDAKRADKLVQTTPTFHLITNYPILGVPFTVKESCSLKGKYLYPEKKKQNINDNKIHIHKCGRINVGIRNENRSTAKKKTKIIT